MEQPNASLCFHRTRDAHRAKGAFGADGEVAGCDASLPARFLRHAWSEVPRVNSHAAQERIDSLVIRLDEILRADYLRSEQALQQRALKASFGAAHHGLFIFAAMSKVLKRVGPQSGLGDRRRSRIEQAKAALIAQRFFAPIWEGDGSGGEGGSTRSRSRSRPRRLPRFASGCRNS